ncbi:glycoside hydrolase family 13 protein [Mycoplasma todarodis]|uniref:Glycosyl hydrolase family 13 catalytic domain-containing protein n=1 Tax=Mycoplasma todarodis TaxID=1937191 RepID=A0A4R0XLV1_9MOLU|nr:glycoside hydrolase family 13 protein [Mycoplasma todarodis]TCG11663.1 hypothetical protein C4B25_00950 [Mycoplasma todarodis]
MILETFEHRAVSPFVNQKENGKVEVTFKIGKNKLKSAKVYYGDALGLYIDGKWFCKEGEFKKKGEGTHGEYWSVEMDHFTKRYRYGILLETLEGDEYLIGEVGLIDGKDQINQEGNGFTFNYWNDANNLNTPEWYKSINWFQIFPDRFNKVGNDNEKFAKWENLNPKSHELYGGNIKGIIAKLEYIKSLGFSGIYLTPIFESDTSHRYNTKDYYKIDPVLGKEEDFQELINKAHKLGLRVMLDAVYNHIGSLSDIWQDVLKNKENSRYKEWFWINDFSNLKQPNEYKEGEFQKTYPYETFSFVSEMPRLNWNNPEVTDYLLDATKKWTNMGIDGWRLDVSFIPSYDFWRKFKNCVTHINPSIVIIGEVWWDSINYLRGDMWHGVMNYPLRKIIIEYVNSEKALNDKKRFIFRFNEISYLYTPEQQWGMFNLISSHDILRAITLFENDVEKFKLAAEMLFIMPGSTSTYYGEEIGLEGKHDPDNRKPMPWGIIRHDFKDFYREQNALKEKLTKRTSIFNRYFAKLIKGKIVIENGVDEFIFDKRLENYDALIK